MKTLLALLLLVGSANAADFTFTKRVEPSALQKEIIAAGITLDAISCTGDNCTVFNPSADPSAVIAAHVYTDPVTTVQTVRAQAIALAKKLKLGNASTAEKDALLLRLCFLLLSQDQ